MGDKGWIKIWRKIAENKLWTEEKFTRAQAWIDLILLANHKEGLLIIRGNMVRVLRGQVGWSKDRLAKRWGWSRNKVLRFIKWLETEQQIEQQKSKLITLVTIKNYDEYQGSEQQTKQQTDDRRNNRRHTNKNDKNVKNIYSTKNKKLSTYQDFDKFEMNDGSIAIMRFGVWCSVDAPYPKIDRAYYKECPENNK